MAECSDIDGVSCDYDDESHFEFKDTVEFSLFLA